MSVAGTGEQGGDGEAQEPREHELSDLQSDLLLAAELGKTLLERNKEVENALRQQTQLSEEQVLEIEFLTKQIESIREWNESRLKVYEQLDNTVHELESRNQQLVQDGQADKHKIQRITGTVVGLEKQVEEQQMQIAQLQEALREHKKQEHKFKQASRSTETSSTLRRYHSFENGFLEKITDAPDNPYEAEISRLKDSVKYLRGQQTTEKQRREVLQEELSRAAQENQALESKLADIESKYEEKMSNLQSELQAVEISYGKFCAKCKNTLDDGARTFAAPDDEKLDLEQELEDEGLREIRNPEALRLQSGGLVYGSRDTFARGGAMLQSVGAQPLLSEIHSHYRRLVDKYEEILQRSGRKSYLGTSTDDLLKLVCKECYTSEEGAPLINTGAQTDGCARATCAGSGLYKNPMIAQSDSHIVEKRFEHAPAYRKLFAEIFETLRRQYLVENPVPTMARVAGRPASYYGGKL